MAELQGTPLNNLGDSTSPPTGDQTGYYHRNEHPEDWMRIYSIDRDSISTSRTKIYIFKQVIWKIQITSSAYILYVVTQLSLVSIGFPAEITMKLWSEY